MNQLVGWVGRRFCCHFPENQVNPVVSPPQPPDVFEMNGRRFTRTYTHQYVSASKTWREWNYKITFDAELILGNDYFDKEDIDWKKIRIGIDALQQTDIAPTIFPEGHKAENVISIPRGQNGALFLSFERTLKMLRFLAAAMHQLECSKPEEFFEYEESLQYFKQLVEEWERSGMPPFF